MTVVREVVRARGGMGGAPKSLIWQSIGVLVLPFWLRLPSTDPMGSAHSATQPGWPAGVYWVGPSHTSRHVCSHALVAHLRRCGGG